MNYLKRSNYNHTNLPIIMNTHVNYCKYCTKYFHYKDSYNLHIPTCEFFYRSKRQIDRNDDCSERLPSPQDQFKLIQYLTLKIHQLESDVSRLKISSGTRKRKVILDLLNNPTNPKPSVLFENWYKSISLTMDDLIPLFDYDITNGIQYVLERYLNNTIPICSFQQKENSIYIWTTNWNNTDSSNPKWILLDINVYNIWMRYISHLFLEIFLKWQIENDTLVHSSEKEKEKNIENMHKLNGLGEKYEKKRKFELHKWIYNKIAKDVEFNNEYC